MVNVSRLIQLALSNLINAQGKGESTSPTSREEFDASSSETKRVIGGQGSEGAVSGGQFGPQFFGEPADIRARMEEADRQGAIAAFSQSSVRQSIDKFRDYVLKDGADPGPLAESIRRMGGQGQGGDTLAQIFLQSFSPDMLQGANQRINKFNRAQQGAAIGADRAETALRGLGANQFSPPAQPGGPNPAALTLQAIAAKFREGIDPNDAQFDTPTQSAIRIERENAPALKRAEIGAKFEQARREGIITIEAQLDTIKKMEEITGLPPAANAALLSVFERNGTIDPNLFRGLESKEERARQATALTDLLGNRSKWIEQGLSIEASFRAASAEQRQKGSVTRGDGAAVLATTNRDWFNLLVSRFMAGEDPEAIKKEALTRLRMVGQEQGTLWGYRDRPTPPSIALVKSSGGKLLGVLPEVLDSGPLPQNKGRVFIGQDGEIQFFPAGQSATFDRPGASLPGTPGDGFGPIFGEDDTPPASPGFSPDFVVDPLFRSGAVTDSRGVRTGDPSVVERVVSVNEERVRVLLRDVGISSTEMHDVVRSMESLMRDGRTTTSQLVDGVIDYVRKVAISELKTTRGQPGAGAKLRQRIAALEEFRKRNVIETAPLTPSDRARLRKKLLADPAEQQRVRKDQGQKKSGFRNRKVSQSEVREGRLRGEIAQLRIALDKPINFTREKAILAQIEKKESELDNIVRSIEAARRN